MSRTDDILSRRFLLPDEEVTKDGRKYLEIGVYFSEGGHNAWTGESDGRGIWISFWPVDIANGVVTRTVFDKAAWRMKYLAMSRRNQRTFDQVRTALDPHLESLVPLWKADNRAEINRVLTAVKQGGTAFAA